MRILGVVVVGVALLPAALGAQAADSLWDHNGSKMLLQAEGAERTISYLEPRTGLKVDTGFVLFQGRREGDRLVGTAFTFREGCSPAPYAVEARIRTETAIVLRGAAPVRPPGSCKVLRYDDTVPNATLELRYVRRIEAGGAPPAGDSEGSAIVFRRDHVLPFDRGTVIVRFEDQQEPAAASVVVSIDVKCNSGETQRVLAEERMCGLDNQWLDTASGTVVLETRQYDGHDCALTRQSRVDYAGVCR